MGRGIMVKGALAIPGHHLPDAFVSPGVGHFNRGKIPFNEGLC